jgi:hypothetical protein
VTNRTQGNAAKTTRAVEFCCAGARSPQREGSCQGGPTRHQHKRDRRIEANETDKWVHAAIEGVYAGSRVDNHWRAGPGCRRVCPRVGPRSEWMGRLRGFLA